MSEQFQTRQTVYKGKIPPHFAKMYSRKAIYGARWYLKHEYNVITTLLSQHAEIDNAVVIGSGPNSYLELVKRFNKNYIGIDPYYHVPEANHRDIFYFDLPFESIQRAQLPPGSCLFIFWFNVLHYLSDPKQSIIELSRPGDLILHSTWSAHLEANLAMNFYFKAVYRNTNWCYKKAIARIREKNSELKVHNLFEFCKNKSTYENNINICDVYVV